MTGRASIATFGLFGVRVAAEQTERIHVLGAGRSRMRLAPQQLTDELTGIVSMDEGEQI